MTFTHIIILLARQSSREPMMRTYSVESNIKTIKTLGLGSWLGSDEHWMPFQTTQVPSSAHKGAHNWNPMPSYGL